jgi:hypothetical protein
MNAASPTSNIDAPNDGECADPHTLLGPAITFGFVFQLGESGFVSIQRIGVISFNASIDVK